MKGTPSIYVKENIGINTLNPEILLYNKNKMKNNEDVYNKYIILV